VISGVGNTKLIALSPYDMTLVVMTRTPSILVGMGDCPAVVSVWMVINPSELEMVDVDEVGVEDELGRLDDAGVDEVRADEDPTRLDEPDGVLRIDEDLERLDEVRLILDEVDDLDVDDEELLDWVLEDVEFNGGATVVRTIVVPGLGGPVVGPFSELTERTDVSVKTLVDAGVEVCADIVDDEGAIGLDAVDDNTPELLTG
jgi:hypothetical protein